MSETIYKCQTCGKEFQNHRALNAHQISHKDGPRYSVKREQKNRINPRTYECKQCGKEAIYDSRKTNQYCSQECSSQSQRVHHDPNERKRILRARANSRFIKYKMKKKNQTPPDADLDKIKEIYENCPEGHHVDHIIPISKGGLHHQDNLQYLTAADNIAKGNMMPDEWEEYKKK